MSTLADELARHRLVTLGWRIIRAHGGWAVQRVADRRPAHTFDHLVDALRWVRGGEA